MTHPPIPIRKSGPVLALAAMLMMSTGAMAATGQSPFGEAPAAAAAPRIHVAQSAEAAQLALRIQQLEEQIRNLTGQIDGLQFQLTQMQTLIERQTEDNEFRFQQLEGGAAGKTEAATQSGGAMPSGALPQDQNGETTLDIPEEGVLPLPGEMEFDPNFDGPGGGPIEDDLGESRDPMLNGGPERPLGVMTEGALDAFGPGPLDLTLREGGASDPDADAQYQAGYDAIVRGDYDFAEEQFRQFVALYPRDPQAPDATNWLGEALLARQAYGEAADVLLTGFQNYQDTPRAPDLLLKLGVALIGAGENEAACRTLAEVPRRFSALSPAFQTRLAQEQARAQCPL
ncbi:tol-pal system protein YbgF [Arsenicitalea aurantiaca]|uniref:Cell division coordinator CpoB n=1 Tax=Arsenicitalea aurantiaca TaxID=1783274 RepID=A0A433XKP3_9HYPH|nr:tol-pal system protein YbgF [Arsenicitalea aurantiaca]RUT34662.1 tol-pal system protein YbgF [Arsenicitalea aurantiaca]